MRAAAIDRRTRSLHHRWTALATIAAVAAAGVTSFTGGPDSWVRLVIGVVSVAALAAACREQLPLRVGVGLGLLNAAIVPVEAGPDRTLIAAVAALALLVAAESTVVAQRLITSAPVTSTRSDVIHLLTRTAIASGAVLLVVGVAQIGRLGAVAALVGAAGAAVVLAVLTTADQRIAEP